MNDLKYQNSQDLLLYDIWLQDILKIGNNKTQKIFENFATSKQVFLTNEIKLKDSKLFSEKELSNILKRDLSSAYKILKICEEENIKILGISSSEFPKCLRNIFDPPIVLYYKGVLPDVDNLPTFCIVGPREVSQFGEKAAYSLGFRLAKGGMVIVSGGALGSDSAAHKGAIKAGGITVAVSPCGLAHEYLVSNRPLRDEILKNKGCLLSECPPKMSVMRHSFQVRNRLMSALSLGVAVIEAKSKSGALITAHHANEQGKDVFVIPGKPTLEHYKGSNKLLSDGAKPLLDARNIFEEYISSFQDKINIDKAFEKTQKSVTEEKIIKKSDNSLSKAAKIVYNSLNKQKFTADDLLEFGISDNELLSILTELEMLGFIDAVPGGFYIFK